MPGGAPTIWPGTLTFANAVTSPPFNGWAEIGTDYRHLLEGVIDPSVRECATAFVANMDRLIAVTAFAPLVTGLSARDEAAQNEIARRINSDDDAWLEVYSRVQEIYRSPLADRARTDALHFGRDRMRIWAAMHPEEIRPGLQAVLWSQLVSAWSAYEILATDLWVAAVNHRPGTLGVNAWTAPGKARSKADEADGAVKMKVKGIDLDVLRAIDFDLENQFGEVIRRNQMWNFNKLEGIKEAYLAAFRVVGKKGQSGPLPEAKQWFDGPGYADLRILESLRHVIVHRGGRADSAFLSRVEGHPDYGSLESNTSVPVDGEAGRRYTIAAITCGGSLLKGVDEWLTKNPRRRPI